MFEYVCEYPLDVADGGNGADGYELLMISREGHRNRLCVQGQARRAGNGRTWMRLGCRTAGRFHGEIRSGAELPPVQCIPCRR